MAMPFRTFLGIGWLVGFNLVFYGILRCVTAYKLFSAGEKKQGTIVVLCAILLLLCGIFAVGHPIMTMISVGYIIAINLMVQGITTIVMACMTRTNLK